LRDLLHEDLQARAAAQGRALDADIALEGLRAFGAPKDVAARHNEPWTIVPPTETRRFLFAAIIGVARLGPDPADLGARFVLRQTHGGPMTSKAGQCVSHGLSID
jgi:hypothetical protein